MIESTVYILPLLDHSIFKGAFGGIVFRRRPLSRDTPVLNHPVTGSRLVQVRSHYVSSVVSLLRCFSGITWA